MKPARRDRYLLTLGWLTTLLASRSALADEGQPLAGFSATEILEPAPPYFRIEAVNISYSHFEQSGNGYQSRAGNPGGPGSERLTVEQPQLEVIAKQGEDITHRLWVPVDVVTSASADAIDVISSASLRNEAGSVDWTTSYVENDVTGSIRNGFHAEENYYSWNAGLAVDVAMAEDNTVVSLSVNEVLDWFDDYKLNGKRKTPGHITRNALNANLGVTQLISPTTIAFVEGGATLQTGDLSNGWNIVPLTDGGIVQENLPEARFRSSFVARVAQYLPFEAAARASYRFYVDDWGILGHTLQLDLNKRLAAFARLRLSYRLHDQTGASFFTTRSPTVELGYRTADSDLADLTSHTLGFLGTFEFSVPFARSLHIEYGIDRYFRSNDLQATIYSLGTGITF